MALFRWGNAFDAFRDIEREVDRLMRSLTVEGFRLGRPFPAVNICELDHEYLLTAQLPGVERQNVELSVSHGVLTIKGRRGPSPSIPEERFRRRERPSGEWERTFSLPDKLLEEEMSAELNDGVLAVHLPKAPSEKARQIPVIQSDR